MRKVALHRKKSSILVILPAEEYLKHREGSDFVVFKTPIK